MFQIDLQTFQAGEWHDAMRLTFEAPELGFRSPCSFAYQNSYVLDNIDHLPSVLGRAVSAVAPLDWTLFRSPGAPAFLYDIVPSGAARRFLIKVVGRDKPQGVDADLYLLARCTPAPIGHLRVRQSVAAPLPATEVVRGFARDDVIHRDSTFLDYAYEQGAPIGGATGAGGEAPKLLMAEDRTGLLYPDATLPDEQAHAHWLVKFARNKGGQTDQDILRSEYHYYRALQQLDIDTVPVAGLALEEARKPSLWMRRFDRAITQDAAGQLRVQRLAMESVYSLCSVTIPGHAMQHTEVLQALARLWREVGQGAQIPAMVSDYLRRDLLNKILGNSDNHGRNTSIIRGESSVRLAPIYDLAPMVMDEEGITRVTKWPTPLEVAGMPAWAGICAALADLADPEWLFEQLRRDAARLRALPDLLAASGLPTATWRSPGVHLQRLDQSLTRWGLL